MSNSLKEKAGFALFWNFIDKGGQQIIQMVFMIVLSRMLSPEEFGLVAILGVFTIAANILQESGFTSALVRQKKVDEIDFSSVFYFNVVISIVLYIILFVFAPTIGQFYDEPMLSKLSRVIFLSFVFNAFGIIQNARLIIKMRFQINAKITFISGVISGIIAVAMAYLGYGVWSLVAQLTIQALIRTIFLWIFVRWYPRAGFSLHRIKSMFAYSVNLLLNALFNQIASKIYALVIGKNFSATDVGYYDQAFKLNNISQGTISVSIQGVIFPVLTKIDTDQRIKTVFRKSIRVASFISFPLAMMCIISAHPLVSVILGEKWIQAAPLLQLFAVGGAFYPPFALMTALLQAKGKANLQLRIEFSKNVFYIAAMLLTLKFGVLAMVAGMSVVNILTFFFGYYFAGKCVSYTVKELFKDILPYLSISVLLFSPLYWVNHLPIHTTLILFIQTALGGCAYLIVLKLLKSKTLDDCLNLARAFIQKKK